MKTVQPQTYKLVLQNEPQTTFNVTRGKKQGYISRRKRVLKSGETKAKHRKP